MSIFRKKMYTAALMAVAGFSLFASNTYSWDFFYVSEDNIAPASPLVWFSKKENDTYESRVTADTLSPNGDSTVLYLHSETSGLVGMDLTVTPLTDGSGNYVDYNFSASGGAVGIESGSISIEEKIGASAVTASLVPDGWKDPGLVRVDRLYTLTWTPDITSIAAANSGTYACNVSVEVYCE